MNRVVKKTIFGHKFTKNLTHTLAGLEIAFSDAWSFLRPFIFHLSYSDVSNLKNERYNNIMFENLMNPQRSVKY